MNLADGKIHEAIQAYKEHGCIMGTEKPVESLLNEWKRNVEQNPEANRFIYAGTNAEVNRINDECSRAMREMGKVQEGITYECKKRAHEFKQTIGVGDRIQFNATAKSIDSNLINGNFGTVEKASLESIKVKLDNGASASFNPKEYNGFALGYSGTVYKGQGKTQTDVYVLHGSTWNNRTTYVGATRHKGDFKLYADKNKVKTFEQLTRSMSQGQERPSTLGYLDEEQAQALARERAAQIKPQERPKVQEAAKESRKPEAAPERPQGADQAETVAPQVNPHEQAHKSPELAPGRAGVKNALIAHETFQVRPEVQQGPKELAPVVAPKEEQKPKVEPSQQALDDVQKEMEVKRQQRQHDEMQQIPEKALNYLRSHAQDAGKQLDTFRNLETKVKAMPDSIERDMGMKKLERLANVANKSFASLATACISTIKTLGLQIVKNELAKVLPIKEAQQVLQSATLVQNVVKQVVRGLGRSR